MNAPKRTDGDITADHPGYNYCQYGILRNCAARRSRRQKTRGRRQIFVWIYQMPEAQPGHLISLPSRSLCMRGLVFM